MEKKLYHRNSHCIVSDHVINITFKALNFFDFERVLLITGSSIAALFASAIKLKLRMNEYEADHVEAQEKQITAFLNPAVNEVYFIVWLFYFCSIYLLSTVVPFLYLSSIYVWLL